MPTLKTTPRRVRNRGATVSVLRSAALTAAAMLLVTLSACTSTPPATSAGGSRGPSGSRAASPSASGATVAPGSVRTVATGLQTPWGVAFLADGTALVSDRNSGEIVHVTADGRQRTIATVPGVVQEGEGGLLGLAIRDEQLYAYFTSARDNRVVRWSIDQSGGQVRLTGQRTVIDGLPTGTYHNGGRIAFGPDGKLYVAVGETQRANGAQDRSFLGGKILRLNADGSIPGDNPFRNSPVYSLGHRNPQGIAWDDQGRMWAAEFGQDTWDELNQIQAGKNYGWPIVEGIAHDDRFVDPVQQWRPADASPSGIAIADGHVWIGNLRGQRLRSVPLSDPGTSSVLWEGEYGRLRTVVNAPDGSLWVTTSNTDGIGSPKQGDDRILRFTPAS